MTTVYGGTPPGITGTHFGGPELGCLGSLIPSTGLDGAGYLYAGLALPGDATKELRGYITRWPSGTLTVHEDSSFDYAGAADYALYQLVVDGINSTVNIGFGAGVGKFTFGNPASSILSGNVQAASASPGGTGFSGLTSPGDSIGAVKVRVGGVYVDAVNVLIKGADGYSAANIYVKVAGVYVPILI